jgi:hypothetical protein
MAASLQRVTSDATQPNQTVADLGTFSAPATGGWGVNAMVPLKDAGGNLVSLNLSGATTLRMVPTNGDFDFILFTPAGATGPRFNGPTLAGTTVTLTWTGTGVLQQATVLTGGTGDWTDVPGATGNSYQATAATAGNKFFRLRP